MSENGGTKILVIITICIIQISIGVSGCIGNDKSNFDEETYYSVEIIQEKNNSFEMYLPILTLVGEGSTEIIEEMEFNLGNGTIKLITTPYGNALAIISDSPHIRIASTLNKYKESFLTMEDKLSDDKNDYWLFLNASKSINISLYLFIVNHNEKGGGVSWVTYPSYITITSIGWQKINVKSD